VFQKEKFVPDADPIARQTYVPNEWRRCSNIECNKVLFGVVVDDMENRTVCCSISCSRIAERQRKRS